MNNDNLNIEEVLSYIDPSCDYQTWIKVAMGLKDEGFSFDVFRDWSAKSEKYDEMYCEYQWNALKKDGTTIGTVIWLAQQNGYVNSNSQYYDEDGKKYISRLEMTGDYSGTIYIDEVDSSLIVKDTGWLKEEEFFEPQDYEWKPVNDLITYLEAVFDPTDIVAYTITSRENNKGKLAPYGKGIYSRTAQNIIDDLKKYNSVEMALGTYNKNAGAWIRINPFDSNGIDDANVVSYKHVLVESDEVEISKQIAIMKALKLPISAMVYSGKKSVHAVVKVDARSKKEYTERVNFIFETCNKNGLKTDTANKNESRLSRMPGVIRDNHKQFLIDTDMGFQSYNAWKEWIEVETTDLPDPVSVGDYWDSRPKQDDELIEGIFRQGRKMVIAGPSKIGKTTLATQLALSIANGWDWLGLKCKKGKVLYLNFEVAEPTFNEKLEGICDAKQVNIREVAKDLHVLHLRGYNFQSPDKLTKDIITKFKKSNYTLMIVDPIYKIMDGDENSSEANRDMTARFDRIARECNCSILYVHHFSKGTQGEKSILDRMSGHSTQGRDTDAGVSVMELDSPEEGRRACRVEFELREFKEPAPINAWFDFPIHTVDTEGKLEYQKYKEEVKQKKDKYTEFGNYVDIAFENIKTWNTETNRWEAEQSGIAKLVHQMSKSNATYENFRSSFSKQFTEIVNLGRTTLRRQKGEKQFDKSIIFRLDMDDEQDAE